MLLISLTDFVSTHGTPFDVWQVVCEFVPKTVHFSVSLHKPVPIHANKVEAMETVIYSHQIDSIREFTLDALLLTLCELFKTYGTATA